MMPPHISDLVMQIKKKKELSGLDNSIILDLIENYSKKHKISLEFLSKSQKKLIVKLIRAELRNYSGRFQSPLKTRSGNNSFQNLLKSNSSTKERLSYYPEISSLIKKLNVKSILDLGCGINPLALAKPGIIYCAADIRNDNLELVEKFFRSEGVKGRTFIYDLRKIDDSLPSADLCILFKVLDVLEKKGHKLAEKIVKTLKCRYLLISFPTKTLSGKPMNHPQRGWIEKMLSRLNYEFALIKKPNEIFYLVKKPILEH